MSLVAEKTHVADSGVLEEFLSLREKKIVETQAASRLRRSPYPEVRRVACEFHEGMLSLRGRMPCYYLKQIAQTIVLGLDGVDEINNQLEVARCWY